MLRENLVLKSFDKLVQLKNKHRGSRIFCLGNGPSIKQTNLSLLKNEVVISTNHVNKVFANYGFFPQYTCITDRNRILELRGDASLNHSTVIVSDHMALSPDPTFFSQKEKECYIFLQQRVKSIYRPFIALLPLVAKAYHKYLYLKKIEKLPTELDLKEYLVREFFADKNQLSFDLAKGSNLGTTVVFTAIQVAAYMGASEIYILGVDADYSKEKYCFDIDDSKFYTAPAFMNDPLGFMNPFFEMFDRDLNSRNIKLFNATLGGRLDCIERKDFYSLFQTL